MSAFLYLHCALLFFDHACPGRRSQLKIKCPQSMSPSITVLTSPFGSKAPTKASPQTCQSGTKLTQKKRSARSGSGFATVVAAWRARAHGSGRRSNRCDATDRRTPTEVQRRAKPLAELAPGKYSLVVEAVREVGGREPAEVPFEWPIKAAQRGGAQGKTELGAVALTLNP